MGIQMERLFVRLSDFAHPRNRLSEFIHNHPFNCQVEIFYPARKDDPWQHFMPAEIPFFNICSFKLRALMEEDFLNAWIRNPHSEVTGLAVGRHLDSADVVCLVQNVLRLAVTQESYQSLGLEGRKCTQATDRYIIDIKLDGTNFRPERRHYERVKECLARCRRDVIMWMVCRRGGACVPMTNLNASTIRTEHLRQQARFRSIPAIPAFPLRQNPPDPFWSNHQTLQTLFNWLAAVSVDITNYPLGEIPTSTQFQCIHVHQSSGAVPSDHIQKAVERCHEMIATQNLPWIALCVRGFLDTPLSFLPGESHCHITTFHTLRFCDHAVLDDLSGENDYIILLLPADHFCVFVAAGKGDTFRTL